MSQQVYNDAAASGYNRAFAQVSSHFAASLVREVGLAAGEQVLDIATGTGMAAAQALTAVGASGSVTAADISPAMVEQAKDRLGSAPNAFFSVEDGQALSFSDESFDVVLCSLGLMFFPDAACGLRDFHRVLRPGGRMGASVSTVPERSFNSRISLIMGRHVPELAQAASRIFSLGAEAKLGALIRDAGFEDVRLITEARKFTLPSFDEYFAPYEHGAGGIGQNYIALPAEVRRAVREDVRRHVGDEGGPIEIEQEIRIAIGRKPTS